MEGLLTRGREIILPGCGRTSVLSRGTTLAACWLHEPQPISNQPVELGFPHLAGRHRPVGSAFSSPVRGGLDPGDHRFRPQVVGLVKVFKDF